MPSPQQKKTDMTIPRAFAAVLAFDLLGVAVTLATGDVPLGEALLVGTAINAPFTFVAVQAAAVVAAARWRAGAAVLALLCLVSLVSGVADGSYATSLTAGERAVQAGIVLATAALLALATGAALRARPRVATVG